mgnify:CR=1 FL=1
MAIAQDPSVQDEAIYQNARKIAASCFQQIEAEKLAAHVLTQLDPHPVRYSIVNARLNDLKNASFSADLAHTVVRALLQPKDHE